MLRNIPECGYLSFSKENRNKTVVKIKKKGEDNDRTTNYK